MTRPVSAPTCISGCIDAHRLIADVVSFKGPHINHLTPRTLDIDAVQARMPDAGHRAESDRRRPADRANARSCCARPLSRRWKSRCRSRSADGSWTTGSHTARFGEIEQRGIALTPKGRALYDELLNETRKIVRPTADGSNAADYETALSEVFEAFPDTWDGIRAAGLGYFTYSARQARGAARQARCRRLDSLIAEGLVQFDPIVYEDFLPVSAAGIFQSNLGDDAAQEFVASPNQQRFEADLGAAVLDEFAHYAGDRTGVD